MRTGRNELVKSKNCPAALGNVIPFGFMAFDKKEAAQLLETEIQKYRRMSYDELKAMMNGPQNYDIISPNTKAEYHFEVESFWDVPKTPGNIRVLISISGESFMSSVMPQSDSFIISTSGDFVGE